MNSKRRRHAIEAAADLEKVEMAQQMESGVQEVQQMRERVDSLQRHMASRLKVLVKGMNIKSCQFAICKRTATRLLLQWSLSEWHHVAKEVAEHDENVIRIYEIGWVGHAFRGWLSWLIARRKFRVVSGRLAKRMHFAARKKLQMWHGRARQSGRMRVAAAKIHRHRDLMAIRQAMQAWSLWIEMLVMSCRLSAAADHNLVSRAFFEWFEASGHQEQHSTLSSVGHFRDAFAQILGDTPQSSPVSGARAASTPR